MSRYYYSTDGNTIGPVELDVLKTLQSRGELPVGTHVIADGGQEWMPLENLLPPQPAHINLSISTPPPPPQMAHASAGSIVGDGWNKVAAGVSKAAGLEQFDNVGAKSLFSGLFSKRSQADYDEVLAIGTAATTPPLAQVSSAWPAPWLFLRLIGFSVLLTLGFYWALKEFENFLLYPAWLFMGGFAIPFSVMIFFLELNVLKNISFYRVLKLVFIGGLVSLIFALMLFEQTQAHEWFGAMAAGPIEEIAKILAVLFVARKWSDSRWTLNGILLGAAVGAGFAAFETAGYIMMVAIADGSGEMIMALRAGTTPFTHIIWTAAVAGALWRHCGDRTITLKMLVDWPVLRVLLFVMVLHALWNSPLVVPVIGDLMGLVAKFLILGLIGWMLVLMLIQSGLNQVAQARNGSQPSEN